MKPDIIVSWPRNCDYPLWRQFIHDNRERFNVIVIVFTETNHGPDYREDVKKAMLKDWVLFIDCPPVGNGDWRNIAINQALLQSYNAPWIWFTEQDFLIADPEKFWSVVNNAATNEKNWIGVKEGDRIHPCCLFVSRQALNQTSKNFGIVPNVSDHFSVLTQELEALGSGSFIHPEYWQHLAGLSHNLRLIMDGDMPNHQIDQFNNYLSKCLSVTVPQIERFKVLISNYLQRVNFPVDNQNPEKTPLAAPFRGGESQPLVEREVVNE